MRDADEFRTLFDRTDGKEGYVSLNVNRHQAHDTEGAIEKPAVARAEGISVNVTLRFGLPQYRQVAEAYIARLGARVPQRPFFRYLASVARFFVRRIDALVYPLLEKVIAPSCK